MIIQHSPIFPFQQYAKNLAERSIAYLNVDLALQGTIHVIIFRMSRHIPVLLIQQTRGVV